MDPDIVFCPNLECPARGQAGQGNIRLHSRKAQRFLCTACHKTFTAAKGTALYRLRTPAETVSLVVTLLAHGCPLQAIVVAFGFDERTVASWGARAGVHGQAVQEHLVEQPRQDPRGYRVDGPGDDGPHPFVVGGRGEHTPRPTPDSSPHRAGAPMCDAPTAVVLYRRVRRLCPGDSGDVS